MQPFVLDFVLVKMDAEIGSYQEDQEPEREPPEASSVMASPVTTDRKPTPSESDV